MDNKENILLCALKLFSNRGYDAVGIQEVADSAGITKPTLYHYFGSKHGLLEAIVKKYGDEMVKQISGAVNYNGNLPLTLEKMAFAFFRFAKENSIFYRMKLSVYFAPQDSESNQAFQELDLRIFGILEGLIHKALPKYGNMRGREKIIAALIIGAINTCIGLWLNGYMELTDDIIRQSLRTVQYGIYT